MPSPDCCRCGSAPGGSGCRARGSRPAPASAPSCWRGTSSSRRARPRGSASAMRSRAASRAISADATHTDLVEIDVGGARLLARVTRAATRELGLAPGAPRLGAGQGRFDPRPRAASATSAAPRRHAATGAGARRRRARPRATDFQRRAARRPMSASRPRYSRDDLRGRARSAPRRRRRARRRSPR